MRESTIEILPIKNETESVVENLRKIAKKVSCCYLLVFYYEGLACNSSQRPMATRTCWFLINHLACNLTTFISLQECIAWDRDVS